MKIGRTLLLVTMVASTLSSCDSMGPQTETSALAAVPNVRQLAGKALQDDPDPYRLEVTRSSSTWIVDDPGSKIFKTKSGKYVVKAGTMSLLDSKGVVVAVFKNFNPDLAKAGETGVGDALETARNIDWKALS